MFVNFFRLTVSYTYCIVTFVDCVHFYDFAIRKMPLEICNGTFTCIINIWGSRVSVKGLHRKTFCKWGCTTKKFETPGLVNTVTTCFNIIMGQMTQNVLSEKITV